MDLFDDHRSGRGVAVDVDRRRPAELDWQALRLGIPDRNGASLVVAREGEGDGDVFVGLDSVFLEAALGVAAYRALGKRIIDIRELLRVNPAAKFLEFIGIGIVLPLD